MISIVAVFNDRAVFDAMLGASVARQRGPAELIALDNGGNQFASAAEVLNRAGRQARGDYLLFAHQDVSFDDQDWLTEAEQVLRALPPFGVAGVAGARPEPGRRDRLVVTNIEDSVPPKPAGHIGLQAPELVDTVDECAFFVPRSVFARLPFDERTCDGWHLYAVDYSLAARAVGLDVYALPLRLYHRSPGRVMQFAGFATYERPYFRALRRVLAKHRGQHDLIHTTCGTWSTRTPLVLQQYPPVMMWRAVSAWARQRLGGR